MLSKENKSIYFYLLFLILIFVYGRAFVGISIYGFRIGELIVAFSLVLTLGAFIDSQFRKSSISKMVRAHLGFVITFVMNPTTADRAGAIVSPIKIPSSENALFIKSIWAFKEPI